MKFLGQVDGKLMDFSEAGIVVFLTWFALSWKQELSEVAIVMERKLRVRSDQLRLQHFYGTELLSGAPFKTLLCEAVRCSRTLCYGLDEQLSGMHGSS